MTQVAELIRQGMHPAEATHIDRDDAIRLIREALKRRSGKTWSVTGGRGTASGWITIQAPPARRVAHVPNPEWHRDSPADVPSHFERPADGENGAWYTSEADCSELAALLGKESVHCQGVTIPAASDYRRAYIAMAMGLPVLDAPEPYWD